MFATLEIVTSDRLDNAPLPPLPPITRQRLALASYCTRMEVPEETERSAPVPVITRLAAEDDVLWFEMVSV